MKKPRKEITRTRNRYAKEVNKAWLTNQKCYIIFKVTDGPCQAEIQENWWEQRADHRSTMIVELKMMDIEGDPFMRSERHGCIKVKDAMFSNNGTLNKIQTVPTIVSSSDSYLWHFAGGIVFPGEMIPESERVTFCEYDSRTRKGFILVTFDGRLLPTLYLKKKQLLQDVRTLKPDEYNWLLSNW